jgi:hypothetical protein
VGWYADILKILAVCIIRAVGLNSGLVVTFTTTAERNSGLTSLLHERITKATMISKVTVVIL